jgi:hypothetical protein
MTGSANCDIVSLNYRRCNSRVNLSVALNNDKIGHRKYIYLNFVLIFRNYFMVQSQQGIRSEESLHRDGKNWNKIPAGEIYKIIKGSP